MEAIILAGILDDVAGVLRPYVPDDAMLLLRVLIAQASILPAILALPLGELSVAAEQILRWVGLLR